MTVMSRDLAKQHCRIEHDEDDALVDGYMAAAARWVEGYTGKLLTRREVAQRIGCLAAGGGVPLTLYYGPDPVDVVVRYRDRAGAEASIADGRVFDGRLRPERYWPEGRDAVATYTAGFVDVPADLIAAQLILIAAYDRDREGGDTLHMAEKTARMLCSEYRSYRL